VHYYFRRKPELLVALIEWLSREGIDRNHVVAHGDVTGSLRCLSRVAGSTCPVRRNCWPSRSVNGTAEPEPPLSMHRELNFLAQTWYSARAPLLNRER